MLRPRHCSNCVLRRVARYFLLKCQPAFQRSGLFARPGANLRHPRSGRKIGVSFSRRNRFDRSTYADLTLQRFPIECQRRSWCVGKLKPFDAANVRVKDEAAFVEAFEQNHPHVGRAAGIHGRERHRVGIDGFRAFGLREPGGEQPQRFVDVREVTGR